MAEVHPIDIEIDSFVATISHETIASLEFFCDEDYDIFAWLAGPCVSQNIDNLWCSPLFKVPLQLLSLLTLILSCIHIALGIHHSPVVSTSLIVCFPFNLLWVFMMVGRMSPYVIIRLASHFDFIYMMSQLVQALLAACFVCHDDWLTLVAMVILCLGFMLGFLLDAARSSTRRNMLPVSMFSIMGFCVIAVVLVFNINGHWYTPVEFVFGRSIDMATMLAEKLFTFALYAARFSLNQFLHPERMTILSVNLEKRNQVMQNTEVAARIYQVPGDAVVLLPTLVAVTTRYLFTIAPRDLISSFLHDHESLNMFSLTLPASTVTEINQMWLRLKRLAVPMAIVCLICACAILSVSGLSPWMAYTMYLSMPFFCVWTGVMLGRLNIKVVKRVFQTFNFWFTMTQVIGYFVSGLYIYSEVAEILALFVCGLMYVVVISLDASPSGTRHRMVFGVFLGSIGCAMFSLTWYFQLFGRRPVILAHSLSSMNLDIASFFANRAFTGAIFMFRFGVKQWFSPTDFAILAVQLSKTVPWRQVSNVPTSVSVPIIQVLASSTADVS